MWCACISPTKCTPRLQTKTCNNMQHNTKSSRKIHPHSMNLCCNNFTLKSASHEWQKMPLHHQTNHAEFNPLPKAQIKLRARRANEKTWSKTRLSKHPRNNDHKTVPISHSMCAPRRRIAQIKTVARTHALHPAKKHTYLLSCEQNTLHCIPSTNANCDLAIASSWWNHIHFPFQDHAHRMQFKQLT